MYVLKEISLPNLEYRTVEEEHRTKIRNSNVEVVK